MQTSAESSESDAWLQIAPQLDDAMTELNERDHHAVALRFFDGKSMKELGFILGTSEEGAKKRVGRAVEKLRLLLSKRGVVIPAALLTSALAGGSVQAAPTTLASTAVTVALAKGAATSASMLWLVESTLKLMAWLKINSLRELSLLETGCLCACLMLSLVLPLMLSSSPPKDPALRISCLKIVWVGQCALAVTGLIIVLTQSATLYVTLAGAASCIGCAMILRLHLRSSMAAEKR